MTTNGEKGTSFTAGEATVETSMDVPQKVKNRMYGPLYHSQVYTTKIPNSHITETLAHPCRLLYNRQEMESI